MSKQESTLSRKKMSKLDTRKRSSTSASSETAMSKQESTLSHKEISKLDIRKGSSTSASSETEQHGFPKDLDIPDRSYGDYFCPICDSHMNCSLMWHQHISGKRHAKNKKKGIIDAQFEILSVESSLKDAFKDVTEPVVGLDYIHEIRKTDRDTPPIYCCFLCQSNLYLILEVVQHCLHVKHRLSYLKEKNPEQHQLIIDTNLAINQLKPLVLEECMKMEDNYGRGKVTVKREKSKKYDPVSIRGHRSNDDSDKDDQMRSKHDYMRKQQIKADRHYESKRERIKFISDDELAKLRKSKSRKRSVSTIREDRKSHKKNLRSDSYDSNYKLSKNDLRNKLRRKSTSSEQKRPLIPECKKRSSREVYETSSSKKNDSNSEINNKRAYISKELTIENNRSALLPKERLYIILLRAEEAYRKISKAPSATTTTVALRHKDSTSAKKKSKHRKSSAHNYDSRSPQQQSMSQPSSFNTPFDQYVTSARLHQYAALSSYQYAAWNQSSYSNVNASYSCTPPFHNIPTSYENHPYSNSQSSLPPRIPERSLAGYKNREKPSCHDYSYTYSKI